MVAHLLYQSNTPQERQAHELQSTLLRRYQVESSLVNYDSREGSRLAQLYDITALPAVVLARHSGEQVERWMGSWPQAGEVSYLAHQ